MACLKQLKVYSINALFQQLGLILKIHRAPTGSLLELWSYRHFPDRQPEERRGGTCGITHGDHMSIRLDSILLKYTLAFPPKMVCVTQKAQLLPKTV